MRKKYMVFAGLSIAAVFLLLYGFNYGETHQIVRVKQPSDAKLNQKAKLAQLTKKDDMVAAILIMPKSYLPALKRFSKSKMARNITILRAQLEMQDEKMTAVHQNSFSKQHTFENSTAINTSDKVKDIRADDPMQAEKPILATGFLYLLASAQKARPLN